jgi:hypothetical protein
LSKQVGDFFNFCGLLILFELYYDKGVVLEIDDFPIFQVLKEFGEDLEDPRIDKIYSSGNRGVKKVQDLGDRAMWKSFCHPYTHVNNVHIALGWLYAIFLDVRLNKCNINRF